MTFFFEMKKSNLQYNKLFLQITMICSQIIFFCIWIRLNLFLDINWNIIIGKLLWKTFSFFNSYYKIVTLYIMDSYIFVCLFDHIVIYRDICLAIFVTIKLYLICLNYIIWGRCEVYHWYYSVANNLVLNLIKKQQ